VGDRWEEVLAIVHGHLAAACFLLAIAIGVFLVVRRWRQARAKA
jgi:hypothetical protein